MEESVDIKIVRLEEAIKNQSQHSSEFRDYMKDSNEFVTNTLKNVSEKVDGIIIQTKLTNGRVNSLEAARDARTARFWKALFILFTGAVTVAGSLSVYFLIHHYKP